MQHIAASLEFLRVLLYFGENLELIIICFYVLFFPKGQEGAAGLHGISGNTGSQVHTDCSIIKEPR